jgi:hypothetical protein
VRCRGFNQSKNYGGEAPSRPTLMRFTSRLAGRRFHQHGITVDLVDHDRQRNDSAVELRRIDFDAFNCAENRDGRRDGAVAIKQASSDQSNDDHNCAPPALFGTAGADQCQKGKDTALAVVVGAHDQERIFDGNDDD